MKTAAIIIAMVLQVQSATLSLAIVDAENQKPIPARVLIKSLAGQSFVPDNALTLHIANEVWFMSDGNTVINIAADSILLRVERGKEYLRIKRVITLSLIETKEIKIELKRWINMKEMGYLSGENHLHLSAEDAAVMSVAEDLDFGSSLQWWNRPRFGVPQGREHTRILSFAGIQKKLTVYDVEVEEDWGAMYIINIPHPFPFLNDPHMPNLIAARYGRANNALNCYQGGWSREVLIDALLGYVDVVNVCNNNFHMHRYQPRSHYSNLLKVESLPVYPNTAQGMMQMNLESYYRLLNCGLKLAAGAGSATGAKEVPPGYNRAYVRSSKKQDIQGFLEAWREGRNFVSNGPMVFIKASDGLLPGDSLHLAASKKVNIDISVISDMPVQTLEIIVNGIVVKSFPVKGKTKYSNSMEINISQSCWVAARCTDNDTLLTDQELEKYKSPRVKLYQDPSRLRFAHTSPIYFYYNKKDIAVKESVLEALEMIKAFKSFAVGNVAAEYLKEITTAVSRAENILRQKLSSI